MHSCSIQRSISGGFIFLGAVAVGADIKHGAIKTVVQRVLGATELLHTDTVQKIQKVLQNNYYILTLI